MSGRADGLRSFDQARGLDQAALRALLVDGDARERVWAAWALGLAAGAAFTSAAAARLADEPDAGVRRHLIVVLAGLGEAAAVRAMAAADPDPYVRATAHRYALRLAVPGAVGEDGGEAGGDDDDAGAGAVAAAVDAATGDDSDIVREECVRMLERRWPRPRRRALLDLLTDPCAGVRLAAAERLGDGVLAPLETRLVVARLCGEADAELRRRLLALVLKADGAEALAGALAELPAARASDLMDLMLGAGVRLPWSQLADVAARREAALDRRVLGLLAEPQEAELGWLASCAVRPRPPLPPRNRAEAERARDVARAAEEARGALRARLAATDALPPGSEAARAPLGRLLELLRGEEASLRTQQDAPADDPEGEPAWDPTGLADLVEQRRRLERLLGLG